MVYTPTPRLCATITTRVGMRRILKQQLSAEEYIRKAVIAGSYRLPNGGQLRQRKRRNRTGPMTSIQDFPEEYQILKQNPMPQNPPRLSKKDMKILQEIEKESKKQSASERMQELINNYLEHQEFRKEEIKQSDYNITSAIRHRPDHGVSEEEYAKILGVPNISNNKQAATMAPKSALLNKAYAFAVQQFTLERQDNSLGTEESFRVVQELMEEARVQQQQQARVTSREIQDWRQKTTNNETISEEAREKGVKILDDAAKEQAKREADRDLSSSVPSVLTGKKRTIQGMHVWSNRLQAVPYEEWTIGATTALDHWIAVAVLGLEEEVWQALLEGIGPKALVKDIVLTRQALYPETLVGSKAEQEQREFDESLGITPSTNPDDADANVAIDDLLESLENLGANERSKDGVDSADAAGDSDQDIEKVNKMRRELQEYRAKNQRVEYKKWSSEEKKTFEAWLQNYVDTVTPDSEQDDPVDLEATRDALLSSAPISEEDSKVFWDSIEDEAEANAFLDKLFQDRIERPAVYAADEGEAGEDYDGDAASSKRRATVFSHLFWTKLSREEQLEKLAALGTLRPILDEYGTEAARSTFFEKHADKLLEGVKVEHLIVDPRGPISYADLPTDLAKSFRPGDNFNLVLRKFGHGDGAMTTAAEDAQYFLIEWNAQKAGRARYEEELFDNKELGLRYSDGSYIQKREEEYKEDWKVNVVPRNTRKRWKLQKERIERQERDKKEREKMFVTDIRDRSKDQ